MSEPGFEDHEHYKTWLRYKEAARKENQWMNRRLGWMMTAQAAILAIYGIHVRVEGGNEALESIIALLPYAGLVISFIGFGGVMAAAQMHWRWTSNLNAIEKDVESRGILSFGSSPHWAARSSSILPTLLAYIFVCFWAYIIFLYNIDEAQNEYTLPISFGIIAFLVAIIIATALQRAANVDLWTPNVSYRWKSDNIQTINFVELKNVKIEEYQACVFDFDGVICDRNEEIIYQLPEEDGEQTKLANAAILFKLNCEAMAIPYQRHLIYQAAAYKVEQAIQEGPAFQLYTQSCNRMATFVLSARSGWFAVERARSFLAQLDAQPIETFQVGRGPKTQQIEKIMEERSGKVIFFEDRKENIERVHQQLRNDFKDRIDFCHVKNNNKIDFQEARKNYQNTLDAAISIVKS